VRPLTPDVEILYVGFLLGHGGDAIQMLDLASGMAARGRRVKAVVPLLDTCIPFVERCKERGIPAERSPWIRADMHSARQNVFNLLRFFRTYRAPILHLHTGDVCLPRTVVLALDILRPPHVFATLHSPYDTLQPGDTRARVWAAAVSRRFEKIFCPSRHGCATQQRYGVMPERLQNIHNSVDSARFGSGDPQKAWRALGVAPGTPLLVFSSRLDPQKRPLDALEAFQRVAPDFPTARLVFVGSGRQEEQARAAAARSGVAERVHFVGYQQNVPDWLAATTVWILPTESENFSLAVLEALAAGCPILSTRCPGNDEVLVEGQNALTVGVCDTDALTAGLRRLLSDGDLRQRLRLAAQNTARDYDKEYMVDLYARCYDEALQSGKAGSVAQSFVSPV